MEITKLKDFLFCERDKTEELNGRKKAFSILFEIAFYAVIFAAAIALFLVLKPLYVIVEEDVNAGKYAHTLMSFGLVCVLLIAVFCVMTKRLDRKNAIFLLFALGVILRIGYMLYTPIVTRQHDTYNSGRTGHEAYAWTIFSTGKLPTTNSYQFYHPPLNATVQALFMKFMESFTSFLTGAFSLESDYFPSKYLYGFSSSKLPEGSEMRYFLFSTTQILSVLYSIVTMIYALKLIKLFDFKGKTAVLVSAIVILFPRHIQFAGMVNNDSLSYMCSVLALYFAVKWQKQGKRIWHILPCALFVGLGMMTKLATATICLPIAGIFVYEFVGAVKELINDRKGGEEFDAKKHLKLPIQYVCFLAICAPLGLWFQFYASAKFDQGFGFVFNQLNHLLKTDHHSLFERLFITFDKDEFFGSLYCICFSDKNYEYYNNYNLLNYQVRSAIFGEFSYWQADGYGVFSLVFAWLALISLFVGLITCLVAYIKGRSNFNVAKEKQIIDFKDFLIVALLIASQIIPEMAFYVKMPYACTMDFRYVMPIISGLAITVGFVQKALTNIGTSFTLGLSKTITVLTIAFLTFSTFFYCACI